MLRKSINSSWCIDNGMIAALYLGVCTLVFQLPQSLLGAPVFPAAGIAVGALLARGRSRAFGVFCGAALNSFLIIKAPILFALVAGIVPAIGALVSTTLVLYFNRTNYFLGYVKHFVGFVIAITCSGTLIQALLGTLNVLQAGLITSDIYWNVTLSWWVGDAVGVLVFAPLTLVWWSGLKLRHQFDLKELLVTVLSLIIISYLALIDGQPIEYLLLPPLLWTALRFGAKVTTCMVTATAMVAAISTAYQTGIFYQVSRQSNSLLLLQLFMGVISVTTIAVLTLVTENNRAAEKLQEQVVLKDQAYLQLDQVNKNLEEIIAARTSELVAANREINSLNQQLTAENSRMSAELAVTKRLQEMILPKTKELNSIKALDIVGFMEPADEVGGDYYDVLQQDGHIKIGIGDVTGHGLESGVIMLMVQTAIRTLLINGETNPIKFLSTVNQTIYENVQRMNSDKNLSLILMDYHENILHLSGQHESVIVARSDGEIEIIDTDALGFPIGLTEEITEFIFEVKIHLNIGDVVVLYTDGVTEAANEFKEQYGLERLSQVILSSYHKPVEEIREVVIADVREFIGSSKVYDDITLVVIKRKL
ncbi:serine phosphatase RsbU, regulator of sigma subunit [Synechococcus sp. PCC 7502]|uniref:SpoIIE family protein phosphatase n=1 Tax=Synechococcus sp. PCC 7502 TaxID=1173263 RepID=UPI00029FF092|nr:SpoIIE family protein phosphatase [Synechococcus sp. PCC 7502]AFY73953.1 serine phosphatase RsbU, regulator of sigma subunit [Synechococcus sp. PCC 7502]